MVRSSINYWMNSKAIDVDRSIDRVARLKTGVHRARLRPNIVRYSTLLALACLSAGVVSAKRSVCLPKELT